MPSLRSNFLRTDISSICLRYELEVVSTLNFDSHQKHQQLEKYFISMDRFIVFEFPYIFSVKELTVEMGEGFNFMLSSGEKIQVSFKKDIVTLNSKEVAKQIHKQMMKNTKFLYQERLNICLNPFEEEEVNDGIYNGSKTSMPGFSIETEMVEQVCGFYLVPLEAKITEFNSLTLASQILLNYENGSFYEKNNIVRYDKENSVLHFRCGEKIETDSIKSIQISPLSGFRLAQKLNNFIQRIKKITNEFRQCWQLKLDSRFLDIPYNFFHVCHLLMRDRHQKSLTDLLGSMTVNNYNHHFRKLFETVAFEDNLKANIYFLVTEKLQEFLGQIIGQFQTLKHRMHLECKINYVRWDDSQNVEAYVEGEKAKDNGEKIFVIPCLTDDSSEVERVRKLVRQFISQRAYFHILKIDNETTEADILAVKNLSTVYQKLRLNPWKVKDIPFGTKPLMVFSIHVEQLHGNTASIAVIGTMNAFLNKHTCRLTRLTLKDSVEIGHKIWEMVRQSMEKFKSIHKCYPARIILYRQGFNSRNADSEFEHIVSSLAKADLGHIHPSVIQLSCDHPLRVFNQIDANYISKETVKSTQLLCQFVYNRERYIHLEQGMPLYRIRISSGELQSEPHFEEKVVELTTKLCFSRMDGKFGKAGLGFIGFGKRLNRFVNTEGYDIEPIEEQLKQGILSFL